MVVPVLLPNAPSNAEKDLRGFLGQRTYVDLRSGAREGYDQLYAALKGLALGVGVRPSGTCPFRGLEAFQEEHALWFFGRELDVARALASLRERRLLAVVGASGSGKSSLVLAGLIPAVRTGQLNGDHDWVPVTFRPGPHPLRELALHVSNVVRENLDIDDLASRFRERPGHLSDLLDRESVATPRERRFLLVIDQFEEAFAQCEDPAERTAFVDALVHAGTFAGHRTHVVWTLRLDFLDQVLAQPGVHRPLEESLLLLGPLSRDQLESAIVRPAVAARLELEHGLSTLLLESFSEEAGDLPLVQFALEELWRRREGSRLTVAAYHAMGGLRGALRRRADEVFDSLVQEGAGEEVRRIFGRLVQLGEDIADTRKRLCPESLYTTFPEFRHPVERLVESRLITAHEKEIEIAHEALIREWPTLRSWINQNREMLRLQTEIARATRLWAEAGRSPSDLWRGVRLAGALERADKDDLTLSADEKRFLRESQAEAKKGQRILRILVFGLLGLVCALIVAAGFAYRQRSDALRAIEDAVKVANFITFTADRDLADVAGASLVRRKLLDAGRELLDKLEGRANEPPQRLLHSSMAQRSQRGDLALELGDLILARTEYEAAFEIAQRLANEDPSKAEFQHGLSAIYTKLGTLAISEGDTGAARRAFEGAFGILKELASKHPTTTEYLRDFSVSYEKLGDLGVSEGNLVAARRAFQNALEIRHGLARTSPSDAECQRDLSVIYGKLGDLAVLRGNLAAAGEAFLRSLEIGKRLAHTHSGNARYQSDLSTNYKRLGTTQASAGDPQGARKAFQRSLEIGRELADRDPSNVEYQRDLSITYNLLGDLAVSEGDLETARENFLKGLRIGQQLAAKDPSNAGYQRDLSVSYDRVGDIAESAGKIGDAREAFQNALKIRRRLAAKDPSNARYQRDLSASFKKLGRLAASEGNLAAAREALRADLEITRRLADQDPGNAESQRDLSVSYHEFGTLAESEGDLTAAREAFQRDLEITRRLAEQDPSNVDYQRDLWVSMWKLAGFPDAGITWDQIVSQMEELDSRGTLLPTDRGFLDLARLKAHAPSPRHDTPPPPRMPR